MKHFNFWLILAALLSLVSCTKDPVSDGAPQPEQDGHRVSIESALAELQTVLSDIDGQTRSGGSRTVGTITAVKGSDVLTATRSGEVPDVEDLVYIVNFENGEGYAILGADDRLNGVLAITEQGSLTAEDFAAVARGEYEVKDGELPPVMPGVAAYAARIGTGGIGGGGWIPPTGGIDTGIGGGGQPPINPPHTRYGTWQTAKQVKPLLQMKWNQRSPYNKLVVLHKKNDYPVAV